MLCVIEISDNCNLKCRYCYTLGTEGGEKSLTLGGVVQFLKSLFLSNYREVSFVFHGGEPLLNWQGIKECVCLIQSLKPQNVRVEFLLQTNGTLLDQEKIRFIKKNKIKVGVSIDGPGNIHNAHRIYPNGKGSYEDVLGGISLLKEHHIPFTTISVIVNPSDATKICEFFIDENISNMFALNPVYPLGRFEKRMTQDEYRAYQIELAQEHIKVARRIIRNNITNDFKIIELNLREMLKNLLTKRRDFMCLRSPCGAGELMLMLDSNGDIYPCPRMKGKRECVISNVEELNSLPIRKVLQDSSVVKKIRKRKVENIKKCRACEVRNLCGGDCTAASFNRYHSFDREGVLCEYRKRIFKKLVSLIEENPSNAVLLVNPWNYKAEISGLSGINN